MKDLRIGVVGNGVVGNATVASYRGYVKDVLVYDIEPTRSPNSAKEVAQCDLIFICLPTPQVSDGLACNTNALDQFFSMMRAHGVLDANFIIRSTVPIGFTKSLASYYYLQSVTHSPEFLTARTAEYDAANPARNLVGDPGNGAWWSKASEKLHKLYLDRWPQVPCYTMTSDESEAVKLFQNGFSAVKIAYFNEIHKLAAKLDLNWERCMGALLTGGWINPMHTQVPGPDDRYGFGGSCLPKDLANLIVCLRDAGLEDNVTFGAHSRNKHDRG